MTSAGVEHFSGRIHPGRGSPARILRAAQFHEFVGQMMQWGRRGDTFVVPRMRTQLVAARTVAEALAELALAPDAPTYSEIAGPTFIEWLTFGQSRAAA